MFFLYEHQRRICAFRDDSHIAVYVLYFMLNVAVYNNLYFPLRLKKSESMKSWKCRIGENIRNRTIFEAKVLKNCQKATKI